MATYNVFLVPGDIPKVILSENSTITDESAVKVGTFEHPSIDDSLGWSGNHVLYHHIKEILYKVKPDGTPGFWPDTIIDMSRLKIMFESDLPVAPAIIEESSEVQDLEDDVVFVITATGDPLSSLEVDHNSSSVPEITLIADESSPWESTAAEGAASAFGITAEYAEGVWTITVSKAGNAYAAFINEEGSTMSLYFVAHSSNGLSSGSMLDGSYFTLSYTPQD